MTKTEKEIYEMESEAATFDQIIKSVVDEDSITKKRVRTWIKSVIKFGDKIFTENFYALSREFKAYKNFKKICTSKTILKPRLRKLLELFHDDGILKKIKKYFLKDGKYSFQE